MRRRDRSRPRALGATRVPASDAGVELFVGTARRAQPGDSGPPASGFLCGGGFQPPTALKAARPSSGCRCSVRSPRRRIPAPPAATHGPRTLPAPGRAAALGMPGPRPAPGAGGTQPGPPQVRHLCPHGPNAACGSRERQSAQRGQGGPGADGTNPHPGASSPASFTDLRAEPTTSNFFIGGSLQPTITHQLICARLLQREQYVLMGSLLCLELTLYKANK